MKNLIILFSFFILISSCEDDVSMLVIRDCTGTYLRYNAKDLYVCNQIDLISFENGAEVEAVFTHKSECNDNPIVCAMPHQYEGIIHVDKIAHK